MGGLCLSELIPSVPRNTTLQKATFGLTLVCLALAAVGALVSLLSMQQAIATSHQMSQFDGDGRWTNMSFWMADMEKQVEYTGQRVGQLGGQVNELAGVVGQVKDDNAEVREEVAALRANLSNTRIELKKLKVNVFADLNTTKEEVSVNSEEIKKLWEFVNGLNKTSTPMSTKTTTMKSTTTMITTTHESHGSAALRTKVSSACFMLGALLINYEIITPSLCP